MEKEFIAKKEKWLEINGFNAEMKTYVYWPDNSYDVKDELKNAGFRFNKHLLWHAASVPDGYQESCFEVDANEVIEFAAWGEGFYKPEARKFIDIKIKSYRPASVSEWIGEEKDKIKDLPVTLVGIKHFMTQFGYSQVVKMLNEDNVIVWFTSVTIDFEPGDKLLLSGTIKKLDSYNDVKQTIMTRCRLTAA